MVVIDHIGSTRVRGRPVELYRPTHNLASSSILFCDPICRWPNDTQSVIHRMYLDQNHPSFL